MSSCTFVRKSVYDTLILMNPKDLAPFLDLANHHANTTAADIEDICEKVKKYGFNAVFVNQYFVPFAKQKMGPTGKVGTVIAFPLGQDFLEIKIAASKAAAINGADELDVSLNVGLIKTGRWDESLAEMQNIVREVKAIDQKKIVKFILETGYLTDDEIKKARDLRDLLIVALETKDLSSGLKERETFERKFSKHTISEEDCIQLTAQLGEKVFALLAKTGKFASKSNLRRLFDQKAVRLITRDASEMVLDISTDITETCTLRVGKRLFFKITIN